MLAEASAASEEFTTDITLVFLGYVRSSFHGLDIFLHYLHCLDIVRTVVVIVRVGRDECSVIITDVARRRLK